TRTCPTRCTSARRLFARKQSPIDDTDQSKGLCEMTVVVTGAATGIGAAIARAFAQAGHLVAVTDLDVEAGARTAQMIDGATPFSMDVRSRASIEAACRDAVR